MTPTIAKLLCTNQLQGSYLKELDINLENILLQPQIILFWR